MDPTMNFPARLYQIIENEDPAIIRWEMSGTRFRIVNHDRFEKEVLPKYFRHSRTSSIQRQLNLYGFRCVNRGEDKGVFSHPNFIQGQYDAVLDIKRKKTTKREDVPLILPPGYPYSVQSMQQHNPMGYPYMMPQGATAALSSLNASRFAGAASYFNAASSSSAAAAAAAAAASGAGMSMGMNGSPYLHQQMSIEIPLEQLQYAAKATAAEMAYAQEQASFEEFSSSPTSAATALVTLFATSRNAETSYSHDPAMAAEEAEYMRLGKRSGSQYMGATVDPWRVNKFQAVIEENSRVQFSMEAEDATDSGRGSEVRLSDMSRLSDMDIALDERLSDVAYTGRGSQDRGSLGDRSFTKLCHDISFPDQRLSTGIPQRPTSNAQASAQSANAMGTDEEDESDVSPRMSTLSNMSLSEFSGPDYIVDQSIGQYKSDPPEWYPVDGMTHTL